MAIETLALQHKDLSSMPRTHTKAHVVICTSNPSTGEAGTDRSLGFTMSHHILFTRIWHSWKPCLLPKIGTQRVESAYECPRLSFVFHRHVRIWLHAPPHVHVHIHIQLHTKNYYN